MPFKLKFTHFSAGCRFPGLAGEGDNVHSDHAYRVVRNCENII